VATKQRLDPLPLFCLADDESKSEYNEEWDWVERLKYGAQGIVVLMD